MKYPGGLKWWTDCNKMNYPGITWGVVCEPSEPNPVQGRVGRRTGQGCHRVRALAGYRLPTVIKEIWAVDALTAHNAWETIAWIKWNSLIRGGQPRSGTSQAPEEHDGWIRIGGKRRQALLSVWGGRDHASIHLQSGGMATFDSRCETWVSPKEELCTWLCSGLLTLCSSLSLALFRGAQDETQVSCM